MSCVCLSIHSFIHNGNDWLIIVTGKYYSFLASVNLQERLVTLLLKYFIHGIVHASLAWRLQRATYDTHIRQLI